jgi:glycosyltransferase involved in cell wall biosynthesis
MKIALIGPGIMPIPPSGWGAVEILIWDYYNELTRVGHDVTIVNTPNQEEIINIINNDKYDFVHLHYDVFYPILEHLKCPKIAITSHYPYINDLDKHRIDGYTRIFHFLINQKQYYHFVLAQTDMDVFLACGADPNFIRKMKNGINSQLFEFQETPHLNKTVYLGKITCRKNQAKYQVLPNVDFIGNCSDPQFNKDNPHYLGEWTREQIHKELTHYTNLLLISDGEADPLVVKEALIAGLGVVVNKSSSENLDGSISFITILEDEKINDLEYVQCKIEENKQICLPIRSQIRQYGIEQFDIQQEVKKYLEIIYLSL